MYHFQNVSVSGAGIRTLLPGEQVEVLESRRAITDVSPDGASRNVKFWIVSSFTEDWPPEEEDIQRMFDGRNITDEPKEPSTATLSEPISECHSPEDQQPKGCSLLSMEPLKQCSAKVLTRPHSWSMRHPYNA